MSMVPVLQRLYELACVNRPGSKRPWCQPKQPWCTPNVLRERLFTRIGRFLACLMLAGGWVWFIAGKVSAEPPRMLVGKVDGRPVRGLELVSATNRQVVLGSDGWIHDFDPRSVAAELLPEEGSFKPLAAIELRGQLTKEFGAKFEVVATRNYLVVKPRGSDARWPGVFEQLHRTFVGYFTVRGVKVRQGNFPMVAIVMPDEATMQQYLRSLGVQVSGVLGVYDRASNRIVMYDHGAASGGVNATICHEAAHQSAFNTGVHSRFAETPHWLVEGIGCLFQSPAMIEGRRNGPQNDRIDPGLLYAYQASYGNNKAKLEADFDKMIRGDNAFRERTSIEDAYALAWALTFYLSEREPNVFSSLVQKCADRAPLSTYSDSQRMSDFLSVSGASSQAMAQRLSRFIDGL
jgi:hypothetical protein